MKNRIIAITHGELAGALKINPPMTEPACAAIGSLRSSLPEKFARVISGTGRRHIEMAFCTGLDPTHWSPVLGASGKEDTAILLEKNMVALGDGYQVESRKFIPLKSLFQKGRGYETPMELILDTLQDLTKENNDLPILLYVDPLFIQRLAPKRTVRLAAFYELVVNSKDTIYVNRVN